MQLHQNIAFGKLCWKFIGVDIWMFQVEQLLLKMLLVSLYINESPALTQAERKITWSRFYSCYENVSPTDAANGKQQVTKLSSILQNKKYKLTLH